MKISMEWLKEKRACDGGTEWFISQEETDGLLVVKKLLKENQLDWANWLIARIMDRKQYLAYAIFAAEQVLDIYEKKYPDNKKPREAIEAARKVLEDDSEQNRKAAYVAAYVAACAAFAAFASFESYASSASAAYAAYAASASSDAYVSYASSDAYVSYASSAASAAASAASSADAASSAASSAAYASSAYGAAARQKMEIKILEYGISLITGGQK